MLEVKDINFKYNNKLIFSDVSFNIEMSHIYGLIGNNGAGKTTLLRCLNSFYLPNDGTIKYQGVDIEKSRDYISRAFLLDEDYYVAQYNTRKLLDYLKFLYDRKPNYQIYDELKEKLNIDEDIQIKRMSLGDRKAAILCAIMPLMPKFIYLDEFLDGIDLVKRKHIKEFMISYVFENDAAIVIASHTVDDIKDLCDKLILFNDDTITIKEDVDEFKDQYTTYQIVSDYKLDSEFFATYDIVVNEIKNLNNIYWVSLKNDDKLELLLEENNFVDVRKISSTMEEVIYYEFVS
ncbi:MAG: ATP-binding cassette domain-containing protein [Erysipelotrichales bacterium]